MQSIFILRYLENCTEAISSDTHLRVITKTGVPREGEVQDSPMGLPGMLGGSSLDVGTLTATRVNAEHGDTDVRGCGFGSLVGRGHPGTKTQTFVAAEAPDKGRSIFPLFGESRCF